MSSRYPGGVVRKNQLVPTTSSASGVWDLNEATQSTKSDIWPYSGIANPISQSLRFRASNTNYLARTYGTPTNNKVWTWSAWVKRGSLALADANHLLLASPTDVGGNPSTYGRLVFETDGTLRYQSALSAVATESFTSSAVYRDPSAWYHIVLYMDAVNTTVRGYVNGTEITYASRTNPTNTNTAINGSGNYHRIGLFRSAELRPFDGYMADVNFIDGQALDPSYFGQTSAITGVWEPKQYSGTYGNNGWHLEFKDTTVGQDTSGNNNDWTPNNFSTTLGTTYDLMTDVPTQWSPRDGSANVRGNYATLNPLSPTPYGSLSNGNLLFTNAGADWGGSKSTFAIPITGKWYAEFTIGNTSSNSAQLDMGIFSSSNPNGYDWTGSYGLEMNNGFFLVTNGSYSSNRGSTTAGGTVLQIAVDSDAGKVWFGVANSWYDTYNTTNGNPSAGTNPSASGINFSTTTYFMGVKNYLNNCTANFGQRPFTYTPPTGFKSLCTTNLPTPTIGATVATAANKYFDATTYTGTGATLSVTNAGTFQPDFVWLKSRSAATNHQAFDAVRGATKVSVINAAEAESTSANTITSFNSNGFTVGTNTAINTSSATYVAWQWWAGGSTVTNTTGSISAQVRASTTTGFSIATYTGNGTGGATIGHGLGAAPSMLIFRNRDAADNSALVWHTGFNTNQGQMLLSSSAAIYNPGNGLYFNSTTPGASVVTLGTSGGTNGSGSNMIMYAWTPIAGFSAFGSYTGNGSADGTFVYTGFRPRYFMIKNTSIESWELFDTSRSTFNQAVALLEADSSGAENTSSTSAIDILSNGFKQRNTRAATNGSGATYIYMAFAENPFKNSLAR